MMTMFSSETQLRYHRKASGNFTNEADLGGKNRFRINRHSKQREPVLPLVKSSTQQSQASYLKVDINSNT